MEAQAYFYQAFGMKITSSIFLPELESCPGLKAPDAKITIGKVPKDIGAARVSKRYYQGEKDRLLLRINKVANYYIKNGKEIVIEPIENGEMRELRLFILGSSVGALLWQRGFILIHGSAVKVKEKCFIITGLQGAGKSTLAASFAQDGYKILSDDIVAVAFDREGTPWAYPSYPQQKLWKDSIESLGKYIIDFSQIAGRIDKYAVPLNKNYCPIPQRITAIYEVRKGDCEELELFPLFGVNKLKLIMNNLYRYEFAEEMGLKEAIFRKAAALAQKVFVSRMIRPEQLLTIEEEKTIVAWDLGRRGII